MFCDGVSSVDNKEGRFTWYTMSITWETNAAVQYRPYASPISIFFKEYLTMNTVHSVMAYTTSALALTYIYLGNVTPNARLTPTITRFVFSSTTSSDMVFRGYELPRLNERLVYLIFFGFHTSILYGILQKAIHRTRLPYKSVSVTNYRLQLSLHVGICTRRIG